MTFIFLLGIYIVGGLSFYIFSPLFGYDTDDTHPFDIAFASAIWPILIMMLPFYFLESKRKKVLSCHIERKNKSYAIEKEIANIEQEMETERFGNVISGDIPKEGDIFMPISKDELDVLNKYRIEQKNKI
jgi:MFS-type transporter involved in bile tolerance (Atg22 family)